MVHTMQLTELDKLGDSLGNSVKMPVLFIGHGSPMNAIETNTFTQMLKKNGERIRAKYQPKAVMVVSAHWLSNGTFVNNVERPETIHDFGGFPDALFKMQYPAPGAPEMAKEVASLSNSIVETDDWGLDHGAWTVLHHLFPEADIPSFEMSIDYYRPMEYHLDLAAQLKKLREKGVLIIGSGNIVHNLRMSMGKLQANDRNPYEWATEFDLWVKSNLEKGDYKSLTNYTSTGQAGLLSVPTPDHYIPILYTVGLADDKEPIKQLHEEVYYGGLSMRTFQIG
jgi:4,5-DOPA dioxygenase extradiol